MPVRLGYDTYSVRAYHWDALQHLEYAKRQKLDAIQFSSAEVFPQTSDEYLAQVRQKAQEYGIQIDAGTGCICELSKSWNPKAGSPEKVLMAGIDISRRLGAKAMRCLMGTDRDREGGHDSRRRLMDATIRNLKLVRSRAQDANVTIALENHKDLQAWQMRELIEEAGKDFVGSNLDIGNPVTILEDPMTTIETLGPYAVTSHFRDSAVYETKRGAAAQWTAMGDGSLNLPELVSTFAKLSPRSAIHLEIITGRPPYDLPYLNDDYWKTFDDMPAKDFARFVRLAREGAPFSGKMVIEDSERQGHAPEFNEVLKNQQEHDLTRSLQYCREVLHIGPQA